MNRQFVLIVAAATSQIATPIQAQTAPQSRTIPVTFTGVVTNEITDTIKIRQPDGTLSTFTGPIPDYPYKKGDTVTISFNTQMPTKAYYDAYTGQQSSDGIYRIRVQGRSSGSTQTFGQVNNVDISGPAKLSGFDGFGIGNFFIVYNSRSDTYSLDFGNTDWSIGPVDFPTYNFDVPSGQLTPRATSCFGPICESTGNGIRGNASSAAVNLIPVIRDPGFGESIGGFFDILFGGSWNLPQFNSNPGDPVDVPEPASILFFGAGAAGLAWRRRRALKSAD